MDPNHSQELDSIDHWNLAVDAEDADDYQTAIEEYDACLCSSPDAETALEAFYQLPQLIFSEYDLDEQELDDEQLAWRCCLLACCERVCQIYEAHQEFWAPEKREAFKLFDPECQALLAGGEPSNEDGVSRGRWPPNLVCWQSEDSELSSMLLRGSFELPRPKAPTSIQSGCKSIGEQLFGRPRNGHSYSVRE